MAETYFLVVETDARQRRISELPSPQPQGPSEGTHSGETGSASSAVASASIATPRILAQRDVGEGVTGTGHRELVQGLYLHEFCICFLRFCFGFFSLRVKIPQTAPYHKGRLCIINSQHNGPIS